MRRRATRRSAIAGSRGLTLVEVLVVMVIAVLLVSGTVFASGAIQRARLKTTAVHVVSAVRTGYQRASSTGMRLRLVVDMDERAVWLEESTDKMTLDNGDVLGTGGADPATAAERAALAEANRINAGESPPRASFRPVEGTLGKPHPLEPGIAVRAVDAAHDRSPRMSGRGYIYFFASAAERASVQLKIASSTDDRDVLSVVVAPLSGKATIVDGPVPVPHPRDDAEASEAEDDGR